MCIVSIKMSYSQTHKMPICPIHYFPPPFPPPPYPPLFQTPPFPPLPSLKFFRASLLSLLRRNPNRTTNMSRIGSLPFLPIDLKLHPLHTTGEILLQTNLLLQEISRFLQPFDIFENGPRRVLSALHLQALSNDVDHDFVQSSIKCGAGGAVCFIIPAFVAAVGIEVTAQLDD